MPSRMLRDGYVTSDKVAKMGPAAQDRFPRYFLAADDFGCFQLQPRVLKGRIFPLRDDMDAEQIAADLGEYERVGCLFTWEADGKMFAFLTGWWEHNRAPRPGSKRKTPEPPHPQGKPRVTKESAADAQTPAAEAQRDGNIPQKDLPAVALRSTQVVQKKETEPAAPVSLVQPELPGYAPAAKPGPKAKPSKAKPGAHEVKERFETIVLERTGAAYSWAGQKDWPGVNHLLDKLEGDHRRALKFLDRAFELADTEAVAGKPDLLKILLGSAAWTCGPAGYNRVVASFGKPKEAVARQEPSEFEERRQKERDDYDRRVREEGAARDAARASRSPDAAARMAELTAKIGGVA